MVCGTRNQCTGVKAPEGHGGIRQVLTGIFRLQLSHFRRCITSGSPSSARSVAFRLGLDLGRRRIGRAMLRSIL
jgi:hypothetical protein